MPASRMAWRASRVAYADVAHIRDALDVPEPVAWTLVRRGHTDPSEAEAFLAADGPLRPPEETAGAAEAAARLERALARNERIAVHGDYDCDGVVSTVLLARALRARGAAVRTFLPSRFEEGYGVAAGTVERLADEGCDLLVCVDCGTTAVSELTLATDLGMDVIVCDHHLAGGRRPPGILVNPALGPPRDDLPAAAGVVFAVVRALAARGGDGRLVPPDEDGIDLVALATVADAVPLVGENRRLVARGLAAIRGEPRPGLAALAAVAGSDPRAMTARGLGFTLGPAINAAGRLAHADEALGLLLADDREVAMPIARRLWGLNEERREVERRIVAEAVAIVEAEPPDRRAADALVVAGDGWHEGVVGIVASRLVDRFERPAIVLTRDGERAKGSGRSLPGVDLHALVGDASEDLTRWGGHAGAVGLELPAERVGAFRDRLVEAAAGIRSAIERARVREVDAVVGVRDLTLPNAEAVERLAPFGRGNPQPAFAVPAAQLDGWDLVGKGEHVRMRLRAGGAHTRAIAFRWGRRAAELEVGERYDAVVSLGVDRWQDTVGPRVELTRLEALRDARADGDSRVKIASGPSLRALIATGLPDAPPAPLPTARPATINDRRGLGSGLPTLAALAGADRGVVGLVADVGRRARALDTVLRPDRLGAEGVVVPRGGDSRALGEAARRGAVVGLVDLSALPGVAIPEGVHVALIDPPADEQSAAWLRARVAGHHMHLLFGPDEIAFARDVVESSLDLRPLAAALWRAIAESGALDLTGEGEEILERAGSFAGRYAVASALLVMADVGLVSLSDEVVRALPVTERRDLADSPRYRESLDRLEGARRFLGVVHDMDLAGAADAGVAPG